jgi:hypothetical protein
MISNTQKYTCIILTILIPFLTGCEKYLENTKLPSGTIAGSDAFVSDHSVSAIVTGGFLQLNDGGPINAAPLTGLYTDELVPLPGTTMNTPNWTSYQNVLVAGGPVNFWTRFYERIYAVNAAIEGINNTPAKLYYKDQWLGESYFTRAFLYYNLVNLYGDAVLALTTDYSVNGKAGRSSQTAILAQMIDDLTKASTLLSTAFKDGYAAGTSERARPNKGAANALLAKVYCMAKEWAKAEAAADSVINNTSLYQLETITDVFLKNSKETIWALATENDEKAFEYDLYNHGMPAITAEMLNTYSVFVSLSEQLLNQFEPADARYKNWVRTTIYTGVTPQVTYYFPDKYKSTAVGEERSIVLRLADIYLLRAEARAQQGKIQGAQADLNAIRTRAELPNTTAATRDQLLAAVAKERRVELFTECGNRFFDLKRTGTIDAVMTVVAPQKGAAWNSFKQVWPIPTSDITYNPNIEQNKGY